MRLRPHGRLPRKNKPKQKTGLVPRVLSAYAVYAAAAALNAQPAARLACGQRGASGVGGYSRGERLRLSANNQAAAQRDAKRAAGGVRNCAKRINSRSRRACMGIASAALFVVCVCASFVLRQRPARRARAIYASPTCSTPPLSSTGVTRRSTQLERAQNKLCASAFSYTLPPTFFFCSLFYFY